MLKELFDKFSCDKASRHSYHEIYEPHFEPLKDKNINILEIGIFKGASTAAFTKYFPNAHIYGIDIFERINPEEVPILNHKRVTWMKGDSTKKPEYWPDVEFDIIIDDGRHTPFSNLMSFRYAFPRLKKDGMYFIEDVWALDKMRFEHQWTKTRPKDFNMDIYNSFLNEIAPHKVTHYDNTANNQAESYIIKVENKDED